MIRFSESEPEIQHIPTIDEMPPDVISAVWWDEQDYSNFRQHCELTVEQIERGKKLKDKKHSAVGLEGWTKKGYEKRERYRIESVDAVMDEQQEQWVANHGLQMLQQNQTDNESKQGSQNSMNNNSTQSSRMIGLQLAAE